MSQRQRHVFTENGWQYASECGCIQCDQHRDDVIAIVESRLRPIDIHFSAWVLIFCGIPLLLHIMGLL